MTHGSVRSTPKGLSALVPSVIPPMDHELDRLVAQLSSRCDPIEGEVRRARRSSLGPVGAGALPAALGQIGDTDHELVVVDLVPVGALDLDGLRAAIRASGRWPILAGRAPHPRESTRLVAIVGPQTWAEPQRAPDDFRVAALVIAYNEVDIIRPTVEYLNDQGIEVHLIDNWSTDGTADEVRDLVGSGISAIEQFPPGGRSDQYDWTGLLQRASEVAATLPADWCVLHDVDERRDSPWPGITYRDAFYNVDRLGYTAIDHSHFEFRPTDDGFVPGTEVSEHLTHFELAPGTRNATHVKGWRQVPAVDVTSGGGHDVMFDGRRVFPLNFGLRHYPIRSQTHGEKKVFRDRKPRYAASELSKGWHYHYAKLNTGHQFLRDPRDLETYDSATFGEDYLLERLARSGIPVREPGLRPWGHQVAVQGLRRVGLLQQAAKTAQRVRR